MRISDWSSTCALPIYEVDVGHAAVAAHHQHIGEIALGAAEHMLVAIDAVVAGIAGADRHRVIIVEHRLHRGGGLEIDDADVAFAAGDPRSEEHTSELQSLMRISYAVFCLKKKKNNKH